MSAGLRYKFQGSKIEVVTGFAGGSPLLPLTGITNANPAVVTAALHGLNDGDVVAITEVLGMTEVNNTYIVNKIDANTFSLEGVDSTGYGTYTSGGKINPATWSNFCELTDYTRAGGTSPEIPATTVCSVATEYEVGLPDFGTTTLSFNFAPATAVQGALLSFYESGAIMAVRVTLPKSGGLLVQLGYVQTESEKAAVNGLWTATATIRNTGQRSDF